jgi:hypothetical protein
MISEPTHQLLAAGVSRSQILPERAIGPPGKWHVASPAPRHFRTGTTCFFAFFALVVGVSTIARAIGA